MSSFTVPSKVFAEIEKINAGFFWEDKAPSQVGWFPNCKHKEVSVLVKNRNMALLAKWGWRFIH